MIRSALFVPAHRPRAIEKARILPVDLIILDLEDAVPEEMKTTARDGLGAALAGGMGGSRVAVRVNGEGAHRAADLAAAASLPVDWLVLPKVSGPADLAEVRAGTARPLLAMIESAGGVLAAPAIARADGVAGLIAGTNDLAADLGLPAASGRRGLTLALQMIVLAARAADVLALDGVFNGLDDQAGFAAECAQGRSWGFDGKTLIHPGQVAPASAAFGPDATELEDARALVAAATGGAERFRGRMIEAMHVAAARRLIERAGGGKPGEGSL